MDEELPVVDVIANEIECPLHVREREQVDPDWLRAGHRLKDVRRDPGSDGRLRYAQEVGGLRHLRPACSMSDMRSHDVEGSPTFGILLHVRELPEFEKIFEHLGDGHAARVPAPLSGLCRFSKVAAHSSTPMLRSSPRPRSTPRAGGSTVKRSRRSLTLATLATRSASRSSRWAWSNRAACGAATRSAASKLVRAGMSSRCRGRPVQQASSVALMPPMKKFWIVLGLEAVVALVALLLLGVDPFVAIALPVFLAFLFYLRVRVSLRRSSGRTDK